MANNAYKVRRILDVLRAPPSSGVPEALSAWLAQGVAAWRTLSPAARAAALSDAYGLSAAAKARLSVRLTAAQEVADG